MAQSSLVAIFPPQGASFPPSSCHPNRPLQFSSLSAIGHPFSALHSVGSRLSYLRRLEGWEPLWKRWKGYCCCPCCVAGADQCSDKDKQFRRGKTVNVSRRAETDEAGLEKLKADVVIVGAGIIGLFIALRLLSDTSLSVAIVDAARPCAGATGAGQGYIWLGHRWPGSETWPLAKRSKQLWDAFVEEIQSLGMDSLMTLGWINTGSMLFGSTPEAALALQKRVKALAAAGLQTEYLTTDSIAKIEPHLKVGDEGSAAMTLTDSQIDAKLAVAHIEERNRRYISSGRFRELYEDPMADFLWSHDNRIIGVKTLRRLVYCDGVVVMAAGSWSGDLMENAFEKCSLPFILPTKPRKGHLVVLEGYSSLELKHGLMEFEYSVSQSSSNVVSSSESYAISMTATMDATGHLLLGSSRQFAGFDFTLENNIVNCILERASKFLPALANVSLSDALRQGSVRIGHRPYVPDGKAMIGPVPGIPGLLLATGHEGAGLLLAPGTAEMVVNYIMGAEYAVDILPFLPVGRLKHPDPNEPPVHQW